MKHATIILQPFCIKTGECFFWYRLNQVVPEKSREAKLVVVVVVCINWLQPHVMKILPDIGSSFLYFNQNPRGPKTVVCMHDLISLFLKLIVLSVFGRPYYRSSLWYTVSSVCHLSVCRLSVCDVLYCGEMVHPSEKVSEGVNRKPGSKSWFFG